MSCQQAIIPGLLLNELPASYMSHHHVLANVHSCAVQIGMLFVRCRGGISHSPMESVSEEDVGRAASALFTYLAGSL